MTGESSLGSVLFGGQPLLSFRPLARPASAIVPPHLTGGFRGVPGAAVPHTSEHPTTCKVLRCRRRAGGRGG